jgi:hypothetical protein
MPQPNQGRRAREQAESYESVFGPTPLELEDGTTINIPPHPNLNMLDDAQQEAYEELMFEIESFDRERDIYIPEQKLDNGVILPSETRRGALLTPFRKDGELVRPPHSVRVVQAALGPELYAALRAGGRSAADVWRTWNAQGLRIADRAEMDPKSNGGARGLVALPR